MPSPKPWLTRVDTSGNWTHPDQWAPRLLHFRKHKNSPQHIYCCRFATHPTTSDWRIARVVNTLIDILHTTLETSCAGRRHNMPPPPARWQYLRIYSPGGTCSGMLAIEDISNKMTFDLLTLKVVSESRVTWATSVPILVFVGLSVLDLGPMYATDGQTSGVRQTSDKSIA